MNITSKNFWRRALFLLAALFAGKLLVDFILILRRRIAWWEWLVSLLIVSLAYFQLLILNVSPLD